MAWNAAPGAFTPRGLTELIMDSGSIRFDLFFDAAESWRAGFCPWTFFAYPTSLAVERGLPPDTEACELLAILQRRGIDVSVWVNGLADETTFFACREEDRLRLQQVIQELEESGVLEKDFCGNRSERLFALAEQRTHQRDVATPVSQPAA